MLRNATRDLPTRGCQAEEGLGLFLVGRQAGRFLELGWQANAVLHVGRQACALFDVGRETRRRHHRRQEGWKLQLLGWQEGGVLLVGWQARALCSVGRQKVSRGAGGVFGVGRQTRRRRLQGQEGRRRPPWLQAH